MQGLGRAFLAKNIQRQDGAGLIMRILTYNHLHMLRHFSLVREEGKRPFEWPIRRLIKVKAKVDPHSRR